MIQNVLREIGGIATYGVISVSLFFIVFVGVVVRALTLSSSAIKAMESLPIDPDDTNHE